jgi:hypothetical protein
MAQCPHCQEEVPEPEGDVLRMDELFNEEAEDVDVSVQQYIQLKCPGCKAILGYLALGVATGG